MPEDMLAINVKFPCEMRRVIISSCKGIGKRKHPHLVADPPTPVLHLRDGQVIHAPARLSNGVDDGEVRGERVESCHRGLWIVRQLSASPI